MGDHRDHCGVLSKPNLIYLLQRRKDPFGSGGQYRSRKNITAGKLLESRWDDSGLAQGGSSGDGKKRSVCDYILKVEPRESTKKLDMGCKRKTGVKGDFKVWGLSN